MSIGWRLARGNAALCRASPRAIGAMLMDTRDFERPQDARMAMRIAGDVAIAAVASGSPAEAAGLRGGEELRAVDGMRTDRQGPGL